MVMYLFTFAREKISLWPAKIAFKSDSADWFKVSSVRRLTQQTLLT